MLQYAKSYTPTPKAVGDLSKPSTASGFGKLSDDAINAIPADKNGYYYFKLEDTGDKHQPAMLVRTKEKFSDTARAFGWSANFDVCNSADVSKCDWKAGIKGGRFDTEHVFKNACERWFTDYSTTIQCYGVTSEQRCFNKGAPCGHSVRDHVTMYKWSA